MAWADTSSSFAPAGVAGAPVVHRGTYTTQPSLWARLWDRYRDFKARRETVRILQSLDAATLRDIGVSPEGVKGLVYRDGSDTIRQYNRDWWRTNVPF